MFQNKHARMHRHTRACTHARTHAHTHTHSRVLTILAAWSSFHTITHLILTVKANDPPDNSLQSCFPKVSKRQIHHATRQRHMIVQQNTNSYVDVKVHVPPSPSLTGMLGWGGGCTDYFNAHTAIALDPVIFRYTVSTSRFSQCCFLILNYPLREIRVVLLGETTAALPFPTTVLVCAVFLCVQGIVCLPVFGIW